MDLKRNHILFIQKLIGEKARLLLKLMGAFLFLLVWVQPALGAQRANKLCSNAPLVEMPEWVSRGSSFKQPGYKYGFGEAQFEKGMMIDDLRARALDNSLRDLVSGIRVVVSAETGVTTVVETDGKSEQVTQKINNTLHTESKMELPDLEVYQIWQDYKTCSLYVQVRVDESTLQLVMLKLQADNYYLDAIDKKNSIKARQFAITEAIRLAQGNDFSRITASKSSQQLLREYQLVEANLHATESRNYHAILFANNQLGDNNDLDALGNALAANVSGSYLSYSPCLSAKSCIAEARKQGANYVSVVSTSGNKNKKNGFWVGDYRIDVVLYDVSSERIVDEISEATVRVLNRHDYNVTLVSAVDKWLIAHRKQVALFGTSISR